MTTIVLVPGLMNDAWVWHRQMPALSRQGALFVARTDGHDTITAMAEQILAATCGPLAIAGHSMGGRVAIELYRLAPDRVDRLALLDTGAHSPAAHERANRMRLVERGEREGMAAVVADWTPQMVGPAVRPGDAVWTGIAEMIERADPVIFRAQQEALLARPDAAAVLPTIRVPTYFIVGQDDAWSPPAQHHAMAAQVPGARVVEIANAGHMAPVEAPEAVTAALLDWLKA